MSGASLAEISLLMRRGLNLELLSAEKSIRHLIRPGADGLMRLSAIPDSGFLPGNIEMIHFCLYDILLFSDPCCD